MWRKASKSSRVGWAGKAERGAGHVDGPWETNEVFYILRWFDVWIWLQVRGGHPQHCAGARHHRAALLWGRRLGWYGVLWMDHLHLHVLPNWLVYYPFFQGLNERIIDLVKKRSQLKQAVAKMVTEACTFLDKTPDKVSFDEGWRQSMGKVGCSSHQYYAPEQKNIKLTHRLAGNHDEADWHIANCDRWKDLCGEWAGQTDPQVIAIVGALIVKTLMHRLAKIHEKDGKVEEAAKIMQELQVSPLLKSYHFPTRIAMPSPTPCGLGGDLWVDGETGEGGVDLGADEALSTHPRLYQVANIWISKHMKYSWMIISMFICQFSELKSFPRRSLWDSLKIKSTMNWSWSSTDIWLRYCLCEKYFQKIFSFQLGQHEHDYLGICKHYRSVQDTDSVREVNWRMIGKFWEKKLVPWLLINLLPRTCPSCWTPCATSCCTWCLPSTTMSSQISCIAWLRRDCLRTSPIISRLNFDTKQLKGVLESNLSLSQCIRSCEDSKWMQLILRC